MVLLWEAKKGYQTAKFVPIKTQITALFTHIANKKKYFILLHQKIDFHNI